MYIGRYSIYYERASVLFNLAAHYSQLGQQNRSTEEVSSIAIATSSIIIIIIIIIRTIRLTLFFERQGMKRAANSYQLAAGCFTQTKDLLQRV